MLILFFNDKASEMEMKNKECEIINFTGKYKEKHNSLKKKRDKLNFYQPQGNGQSHNQGQYCLYNRLDAVTHLDIDGEEKLKTPPKWRLEGLKGFQRDWKK